MSRPDSIRRWLAAVVGSTCLFGVTPAAVENAAVAGSFCTFFLALIGGGCLLWLAYAGDQEL